MYAQFAKERQMTVIQSNSASGVASTSRSPNATTSTSIKAQPYRSANTYLDRITIAGLHNYLYARGKYEKIAWNITFLLAIVGTIYYLVPTLQQYLESTIVLDIQYRTDQPALRLPNPWVCHYGVNVTYIRERFEISKPQLEADKRVELLARRYQAIYNQSNAYTVDQLIQLAIGIITVIPAWAVDESVEVARPQFAFEFISKAIDGGGSKWLGLKSFYEQGMLDCESIVSKCTLNKMTFDCCRDNPLGHWSTINKCFALDIRREAVERKLQRNQTAPIELQFETIIVDPGYENYAANPYTWQTTVSFGNRVSGLFDYVQELPGGSESVITVKGTMKKKLANCMDSYKYRPQLHSNTHQIIRQYFQDMADPNRYSIAGCQMGKLYEVLFVKCGCVPYIDSMRPQNDTDICTPAHLYNCVYRAFQNELPANTCTITTAGNQPLPSSAESDMKRDMFTDLKLLMATECLQLCESWTYDYTVFSTSIDDLEGNTSSINRTKVTIVFDPEYRVETEVYKVDPDAFVASLGDAFGLILGFSAVTLIQLPIWSVAAYLFKRKLNKVSGISKQDNTERERARNQ